jgi:formiminotetrahydrofolate cyclodeaminase
MAARYTTGEGGQDRDEQAQALVVRLDSARAACLAAVDEDAAAYAAWRRSRKLEAGSPEREAAEIRCRSAPLELLRRCVELNDALVSFLPWCNPRLACDCRAAIHLIAGAGRAAWQILLSNHPDSATRISAQELCDRMACSDTSASSSPS